MWRAFVVNEASKNAIVDPFGVYSPGRGCLPLSRQLANRGDRGRPHLSSETLCMSLVEYGSLGSARDRQWALHLSKLGQLRDILVDSYHVCLLDAFLICQ